MIQIREVIQLCSYTIENDILRLTVESLGAEAVSVIHKPTGAEMLWSGDPAVWGRVMRRSSSPTRAS